MNLDYVVEAILDDLPAYIREDHERLVEALRIFWKWGARHGLIQDVWSHELRLDIDKAEGREAISKHLAMLDVPGDVLRDFAGVREDYSRQRGTRQGIIDYLKIFHGADAQITDTGPLVLIPSAASSTKYSRIFVESAQDLEGIDWMEQQSSGFVCDVVRCVALTPGVGAKTYEILMSPRNASPLSTGPAQSYSANAPLALSVIPTSGLVAGGGTGYRIGDEFEVTDRLGSVRAKIDTLKPVELHSVSVVSQGTGYKLSDIVRLKNSPRWRAEVAEVTPQGGIVSVRVVDYEEGVYENTGFEISSISGSGATLSPVQDLGVPDRITTPRPVLDGFVISSSPPVGSGLTFSLDTSPITSWEKPIGFNGVIGIGSVLTDSSAWQNGSYMVTAPKDVEAWREGLIRTQHPAGRVVSTLTSALSSIETPPILSVISTILIPDDLSISLRSGESSIVASLA